MKFLKNLPWNMIIPIILTVVTMLSMMYVPGEGFTFDEPIVIVIGFLVIAFFFIVVINAYWFESRRVKVFFFTFYGVYLIYPFFISDVTMQFVKTSFDPDGLIYIGRIVLGIIAGVIALLVSEGVRRIIILNSFKRKQKDICVKKEVK